MFEQLPPGSAGAVPSSRAMSEILLPPVSAPLVHLWVCFGVFFGFWIWLFSSHPDKVSPAHLSARVKQRGSLFGEGKKRKREKNQHNLWLRGDPGSLCPC